MIGKTPQKRQELETKLANISSILIEDFQVQVNNENFHRMNEVATNGVTNNGIHYGSFHYHAYRYEKNLKRKNIIKWLFVTLIGTCFGSFSLVGHNIKEAISTKNINYLIEWRSISSYIVILFSLFIGSVLFYIRHKFFSTDLVDNFKILVSNIKDTLDVFKTIDSGICHENLKNFFKFIMNHELIEEILDHNNKRIDITKFRNEIVDCFNDENLIKQENKDGYDLKLKLDQLNKLISILMKYKYYKFNLFNSGTKIEKQGSYNNNDSNRINSNIRKTGILEENAIIIKSYLTEDNESVNRKNPEKRYIEQKKDITVQAGRSFILSELSRIIFNDNTIIKFTGIN